MIYAQCDGFCFPNPKGKCSYGLVVYDDDIEIYREAALICEGEGATNNIGEYMGLMFAATYALLAGHEEVVFLSDSLLVVNQVSGLWRIKNRTLRELCSKCLDYLEQIPSWKLVHIPREQNWVADLLSESVI